MASQPDSSSTASAPLSRRRVLAGGAVVGGAAWVAPTITGVASAAAESIVQIPTRNCRKGVAVRFRDFKDSGDADVYLGDGDVGQPGRTQFGRAIWQPGIHEFTFSYTKTNATTGNLHASITIGTTTHSGNHAVDPSALPPLNSAEILVRAETGKTITLNITTDPTGMLPGSTSATGATSISKHGASADSPLPGLDDGFLIRGTIEVPRGVFEKARENNKVEILLGQDINGCTDGFV